MKPITSFALLCAFAAVAQGAVTQPVGYYNFDGKEGSNLFVPALVNPPAFVGATTSSDSDTLNLAANSLTAGALDAAGGFPTHYVEIVSGPNEGTVVDIASNTASAIELDGDVSALGLTGTESIVVRPHVTLKQVLEGGEDSYVAFTDSATFYNEDGSLVTYFYDGAGGWTSDFLNADGNAKPVTPGNGFVLGLFADLAFTVTGEVKEGPTVVQLAGEGNVNIVGPLNPIVGESTRIDELGFQNLLEFTDTLTTYTPGSLEIVATYFADGTGGVTVDFVNQSTDTFPHTLGGIITAFLPTSIKLEPGFVVAP